MVAEAPVQESLRAEVSYVCWDLRSVRPWTTSPGTLVPEVLIRVSFVSILACLGCLSLHKWIWGLRGVHFKRFLLPPTLVQLLWSYLTPSVFTTLRLGLHVVPHQGFSGSRRREGLRSFATSIIPTTSRSVLLDFAYEYFQNCLHRYLFPFSSSLCYI